VTHPLADIVRLTATRQGAPEPLQRLARVLADARLVRLTTDELRRINSDAGDGQELHELLPGVLPLPRATWYEAAITAPDGTNTILGYLAEPDQAGIQISYLGYSRDREEIIGPIGPALATELTLRMPPAFATSATDHGWGHQLRTATGIVLRALLLRVGEPHAPLSLGTEAPC